MNKLTNKKLGEYIKWTKEMVPLKDFSFLDNRENLVYNYNKKAVFKPLIKDKVKYIVIHHAQIDNGNAKYYHWLHKACFGWDAIGYHFVIGNGKDGLSVDGEIEIGRDLKYQGAHVKGFNDVSIGICLVGNLDNYKATFKQYESLIVLVNKLMKDYGIDNFNIRGHNEFEGVVKTCPGKKFDMNEFRERINAN
jgi:N-acetylmuramoyl-L-alanine amidase